MHTKLFRFSKNERIGFVNQSGDIIIDAIFFEATEFQDGYAKVCLDKKPIENIFGTIREFNEKWGVINGNGFFLVEPEYQNIYDVGKNFASVSNVINATNLRDYCQNFKSLVGLNSGKPHDRLGMFREIKKFSNDYWLVEKGRDPVGKDYCIIEYFIYNSLGRILESVYGTISDFENGIIKVGTNDKTFFYDDEGNSLFGLDIPFENISKNIDGNYFYNNEGITNVLNVRKNSKRKLDLFIDLSQEEYKSKIFAICNSSRS